MEAAAYGALQMLPLVSTIPGIQELQLTSKYLVLANRVVYFRPIVWRLASGNRWVPRVLFVTPQGKLYICDALAAPKRLINIPTEVSQIAVEGNHTLAFLMPYPTVLRFDHPNKELRLSPMKHLLNVIRHFVPNLDVLSGIDGGIAALNLDVSKPEGFRPPARIGVLSMSDAAPAPAAPVGGTWGAKKNADDDDDSGDEANKRKRPAWMKAASVAQPAAAAASDEGTDRDNDDADEGDEDGEATGQRRGAPYQHTTSSDIDCPREDNGQRLKREATNLGKLLYRQQQRKINLNATATSDPLQVRREGRLAVSGDGGGDGARSSRAGSHISSADASDAAAMMRMYPSSNDGSGTPSPAALSRVKTFREAQSANAAEPQGFLEATLASDNRAGRPSHDSFGPTVDVIDDDDGDDGDDDDSALRRHPPKPPRTVGFDHQSGTTGSHNDGGDDDEAGASWGDDGDDEEQLTSADDDRQTDDDDDDDSEGNDDGGADRRADSKQRPFGADANNTTQGSQQPSGLDMFRLLLGALNGGQAVGGSTRSRNIASADGVSGGEGDAAALDVFDAKITDEPTDPSDLTHWRDVGRIAQREEARRQQEREEDTRRRQAEAAARRAMVSEADRGGDASHQVLSSIGTIRKFLGSVQRTLVEQQGSDGTESSELVDLMKVLAQLAMPAPAPPQLDESVGPVPVIGMVAASDDSLPPRASDQDDATSRSVAPVESEDQTNGSRSAVGPSTLNDTGDDLGGGLQHTGHHDDGDVDDGGGDAASMLSPEQLKEQRRQQRQMDRERRAREHDALDKLRYEHEQKSVRKRVNGAIDLLSLLETANNGLRSDLRLLHARIRDVQSVAIANTRRRLDAEELIRKRQDKLNRRRKLAALQQEALGTTASCRVSSVYPDATAAWAAAKAASAAAALMQLTDDDDAAEQDEFQREVNCALLVLAACRRSFVVASSSNSTKSRANLRPRQTAVNRPDGRFHGK